MPSTLQFCVRSYHLRVLGLGIREEYDALDPKPEKLNPEP